MSRAPRPITRDTVRVKCVRCGPNALVLGKVYAVVNQVIVAGRVKMVSVSNHKRERWLDPHGGC